MVARLGAAVLFAVSLHASTLTHTRGPEDAGMRLTLRRQGGELHIVDDRTGAVVARAAARRTDRVVIRGGSGDRDDTFTIDLAQPIVLAEGIDYDGGAGGFDTLVLRGGSVREQRVTQLTPHDGILDLDGLVVRYTNLEPVTDTVPATNFTITGTAGMDTVTVSDGPGGTTTISSPTFESVTFANKANVTFDGLGGGDTVTFNNPTPATGLVSFIATNVGTVGQLALIRYPSLGIHATGTVDLDTFRNEVANLEITTENGDIAFFEREDLVLGGVSPGLTAVRAVTTGSVRVFLQSGVLTLAETVKSGDTAGDVQVSSSGELVGVPGVEAVRAPAGAAHVWGGRIVLSSSDVRAAANVDINGRGIIVTGTTRIESDAFATNTGGELRVTNVGETVLEIGPDAMLIASGNAGADVVFGTTALQTLGEIVSVSGDVRVQTLRLIMPAPGTIAAPLGRVLFWGYNRSDVILGSATDLSPTALEISDEELDRTTAPIVEIQAPFGAIIVAAPFTFGTGQELILHASDPITATGTGMLSAPTLTIEQAGFLGGTWSITPTSFQILNGAAVPYRSVSTLDVNGSVPSVWDGTPSNAESFSVTPSPTTTIHIDGNLPAPHRRDDVPADTLAFELEGVTNPVLTAVLTPDGYEGSLTSGNRAPVHFENIERFFRAPVDLTVTKTDGRTTAAPGTPVTYTIAVTNPSPLLVSDVRITDMFSTVLQDVTWTCEGSAGSPQQVWGSGNIAYTASLAPNGLLTCTATGTIRPSATGTLMNAAFVSSPDGPTRESDPLDNSAVDTTALVAEADLVVTKSASGTTTFANGQLSYTITLRNAGPSDAAHVVLTDVLPADTSFISFAAPAAYSCSTPAAGARSGTVTCTRSSLPPSATADIFTLVVRVGGPSGGPGGVITNTVSATTASSDPSANNSATAAVTVAPASIPTLSTTMAVLLAAVLAWGAMSVLKK